MEHTPLDTPRSIATAFVQAWNDRDPDRLASLFDEDAEFVNVVGLWWHDREAIRRAHAYGLTRIFRHSTLRLGAVRVKQLSDAIAVVHARMHLEGQTAVAGTAAPGARTTIFSFVVHRRDDGRWSCAAAHNTDVVPGAETNVLDDGGFRPVSYRGPDPAS